MVSKGVEERTQVNATKGVDKVNSQTGRHLGGNVWIFAYMGHVRGEGR